MRIELETNHFPRLTAWHVRKALRWIDTTDLEGLACIYLRDYEPGDPDASKQPPYLVGFLYCGSYQKAKGKRPAGISLYTRDLYFGIPRLLAATPLARLSIAATLAHEVGHHVIASRGYKYHGSTEIKLNRLIDSPHERDATGYALEVTNRMLRSLYFRIGKVLARLYSSILFKRGNKEHSRGNFKRAAELEFRAYMLNTENTDAWQSYLQDRQEMLNKTPAALTDAEKLWIYHRRVVPNR